MHSIRRKGRMVHLIDTPGFDDTNKAEGQILQELAYWLAKSYEIGIRLSGLVYLHRITDKRMQGSSLQGLTVFKRLCGPENYNGVVLATTRWEGVTREEGQRRHEELESVEKFWGDLIEGGSLPSRIEHGQETSFGIIDYFIDKNMRMTLQIQRELVDEKLQLNQTSAGQILYQSFVEDMGTIRKQLEETSAELNDAIVEHHNQNIKDLQQELEQYRERVSRKESAIQELERDNEARTREWEKKRKLNRERQLRQRKESEKRLREVQKLRPTENESRSWRLMHTEAEMRAEAERRAQAEIQLQRELEHMRRWENSQPETYIVEPRERSEAVSGAFNVIAGAASLALALAPTLACSLM